MTTKETFCALLWSLKETKDHTDELCDDLYAVLQKHRQEQDMDLRSYQLCPLVYDTHLEDALIRELEKEFEDEDSWISYFVYELEFGTKDWACNCGNTQDGRTICLKTPEDLYDFLVENIREKRSKEIFGTAVPVRDTKDVKKPYKRVWPMNDGSAIEAECFDYDSPEDKVALQLFTKMYFSECGGVMKGRTTEHDLTVKPGNVVMRINGDLYVAPKSIFSGC
jgi:hypothetical protein